MFKINAAFIRNWIFEHGLSLRQFAAQTGLNGLTVAKLVKDGATASMKTIATLATFFDVDGNSLIITEEATK